MNDIVLTRKEVECLGDGGYVLRTVEGRVWRLAHDSYDRAFPEPADRHWSLEPGEIDIIARLPKGLVVGATTIRSEVAA